jgi:hypothetical protein
MQKRDRAVSLRTRCASLPLRHRTAPSKQSSSGDCRQSAEVRSRSARCPADVRRRALLNALKSGHPDLNRWSAGVAPSSRVPAVPPVPASRVAGRIGRCIRYYGGTTAWPDPKSTRRACTQRSNSYLGCCFHARKECVATHPSETQDSLVRAEYRLCHVLRARRRGSIESMTQRRPAFRSARVSTR